MAGIVAVLLGAVLVFVFFPKQAEEQAMLAEFEREDAIAAKRETLGAFTDASSSPVP